VKLNFAKAVLVGVSAVVIIAGSAELWWLEQPTVYLNLTLGMTMQKVQYAFGFPSEVAMSEAYNTNSDGSDGAVDGTGLGDDARTHYLEWQYGKERNIVLTFARGTKLLKKIECIDFSSVALDKALYRQMYSGTTACPPLFGVTTGMSEQELVRILGKPSTDIGNDKVDIVTYSRKGAVFMIDVGKVVSLGLDKDAQ
jgi:hypothetical protein